MLFLGHLHTLDLQGLEGMHTLDLQGLQGMQMVSDFITNRVLITVLMKILINRWRNWRLSL